jgi:hypothetical protein
MISLCYAFDIDFVFEKNYLGSLLGGGVINVPYPNLDQC